MRIIPDQLRSKNLVPFKKRQGRYKIPGLTTENEVLMDRVDPDLSAEEQTYVRHYLGYADALIRKAEENALPEPSETEWAKIPLSADELLKLQPPADQPAADSELNPATNERPLRAA